DHGQDGAVGGHDGPVGAGEGVGRGAGKGGGHAFPGPKRSRRRRLAWQRRCSLVKASSIVGGSPESGAKPQSGLSAIRSGAIRAAAAAPIAAICSTDWGDSVRTSTTPRPTPRPGGRKSRSL